MATESHTHFPYSRVGIFVLWAYLGCWMLSGQKSLVFMFMFEKNESERTEEETDKMVDEIPRKRL